MGKKHEKKPKTVGLTISEKMMMAVFQIIIITVMVMSSWFAFHRGPWKLNDEPGVWLVVFIYSFWLYISNRSDFGEAKFIGKKGFTAMSIGLFMALFGGANAFSNCYPCSPQLKLVFYAMFVVGSGLFLHYDIKTYWAGMPFEEPEDEEKKIDKSMFK